jgi:hyperosmotically inducible protein
MTLKPYKVKGWRMKIPNSPRTLALLLSVPVLLGIPACERPNGTVPERERTAGEVIDDKALNASVRSALSEDSVKYPDVQVASYRGVVQLSGFVDTREHKSRASDIAKNIAGVKKVENSISVKEDRKP